MKITTRWPLDTSNVNICSFGWEICKTVKCPKLTFFCRSAVMKIFKFFDFLESLLKWWKSPPHDHWTLEMWIFAHLVEKYAKLWNAQNWHFFDSFAYFSPKWANIHIWSVQWSSGGDFHHFKRLSRKSKNLKLFMTADLQKNVNFGHFTVLHISQPNEQIFTFQVSSGHVVAIFIILEDFPESRKIWRFSWPRTCKKMSILGISQFCIFLTQMSKYSHFKCPVVIWWWFSSF